MNIHGELSLVSNSSYQTMQIGKIIGSIYPEWKIGLIGDLGTGKTIFVKGLGESCGLLSEDITSPTFTLVQEYHQVNPPFFHIDLYRLSTYEDLGLYQYKGIRMAIEWADKFKEIENLVELWVFLEHISEEKRKINIKWKNTKWNILKNRLKSFVNGIEYI